MKAALPDHWPEDSDWTQILESELVSQQFCTLMQFVQQERKEATVFPHAPDTFNAFRRTSFADTCVVVLGQDPYHGPGQAHGLSFSVPEQIRKLPPSLRNIYSELASDLHCPVPEFGNLESWADQGVLLLNTVLTVRQSEANSHRKQGWEWFTDAVIEKLGKREKPCVFILWGKPAEKKLKLIGSHHRSIVSAHPSPLSAYRGFFGSRPFSRANEALLSAGLKPVDWASVTR